ncbi:MAG TPA: aminopeptidase [Planctomycetota bacterium]|nr:aminopeptidase [Planctomycetota bacterium]
MRRLALPVLGWAALQTLGGCYLLRQGAGQLDILVHSRSVDEMLQDPSVPDSVKERLELIQEIREFGEREMDLRHSDNYTTYYDTSGRPITFIVTACAKDAFVPYTWWFPIVGEVPYKGFFSREDALDEARQLQEEGLDVSLGTASAYSTLGYFRDPILSTMLEYPDEELASLILHELTHGTIFLPGGADFNEGLANFTGWQGALEFAREKHGRGSPQYDRTVRTMAREQVRDAQARALFERLEALYRSEAPREAKLAGREEIYATFKEARRRDLEAERKRVQARAAAGEAGEEERAAAAERLRELEAAVPEGPLNNAVLLNQRRYGRYEEFRKIFEKAGGDWRVFFAMLRESARKP